MPLDPSIILGVKPVQFDMSQFSPINAMTNAMKYKQLEQEGQLNSLKLQEAQAMLGERNALRGLDPSAPDYESQLFKVNPQLGINYRKEAATTAAQKAAAEKSAFDLKVAQRSFVDKLKVELSSNPSDENVIAFGQDAELQGLYTPEQVKSTVSQLLAIPPAQRAGILAQAGASASERKPQVVTRNLGATTETSLVSPFTGEIKKLASEVNTMAPGEAARIKQEGQRIGLEGRRVAVLEENALRDKDPAFQQSMAAAKATGEAIAKGDVAATQALPKVIGRAEEGIRLIDELIGKRDSKTGQLLKGEKPHPGFSTTVGATWAPGARFVPGTDAASFMSRFDQIKGASFLEAFESLKGGGAITEKEGQKATDAINRMSISSDEKEFIRAAMDLQDVIRKGAQNAQSRVSRTGGVGGRATGGSNIDALLEKYK